MRILLCLIIFVGFMQANEFNMPDFNQEFMRQAFLQTSKADLGGKLQCKNTSGNLRNLSKIKYDKKIEAKALSLIVDSIKEFRQIPIIRDADSTPNIKELALLAKNSALAKTYLMQLAIDSGLQCVTCLRVAEEQIGFILTFMPKDAMGEKVLKIMDYTQVKSSKELLERLIILDSYALSGERLLCDGLKKQDSALLVSAYAHFALSGLNTRALNTLMQAALYGNEDAAHIIIFLLGNGIYFSQSLIAAQMLETAIEKKDYQNALKSNPIITGKFIANENSVLSNIFEDFALWRYIAYGFILQVSDIRYANLESAEKKDILFKIFQMLSASVIAKQSIYDMGDSTQQKTYKEILEYKMQLKSIKAYPFVKTYLP